jgi:hypothetical protein
VKSVEMVVVRLHWHRERAVFPQFAATENNMFVVLGCNSKASRLAVVEIWRKHKFNHASRFISGLLCFILLTPLFVILWHGRDSVCKLLQRTRAGPSIAFAYPIGLYQGTATQSDQHTVRPLIYLLSATASTAPIAHAGGRFGAAWHYGRTARWRWAGVGDDPLPVELMDKPGPYTASP